MENKSGRPRKIHQEDEFWAPIKKVYKYKEAYVDKTLEKIKRERILQGYRNLHKAAFGTDIKPNDMKHIHKLADKAGF
jgi:hypothetical protein